MPGLGQAGRGLYSEFLLSNTPRVAAIDGNGHIGWYSGGQSTEAAAARAITLCVQHGGIDCHPYAEDLSIVWPGRQWQPTLPPGPFVDTMNYGFVPDARFLWHGPAAALGVVVWSHGTTGTVDSRGVQPPSFLRVFNDAGFDIVRFDRAPMVDNPIRAAGWLRDGLALMRRQGYRLVVAAGQSRGGWTSLQILDTAGLADVVIATSPAAHGSGASLNLTAQDDDLRALIGNAQPSRTRVAIAQFANDPFMSDGDTRISLMERLRPKTGGLLLIDRPPGLSGHLAAGSTAFNQRFATCLLHFATEPKPPVTCAP
ncbi:hypothetical protein [Acidisphaera sp. L21]|uniref:hypothetical protein n=1 Tax=Acidisphaera sp. L21 TaxID=1641851 RepID=UPI00131C6AD9|nr:hypothetical protein [Acidisphaera sp. L21]